MDAEGRTGKSRRAAKVGVLAAMLVAAVAIVPTNAGAGIVVTHVATPQAVTPHVVTPATQASPSPSPSPAPTSPPAPSTVPAPQPPASPGRTPSPGPYSSTSSDPKESEIPGSNVPGSPSDPPFPEDLPNHWEADCDLSCKQEWLDYFEARSIAVWVEAQAGGADLKEAARLLKDETRSIEDEITAQGGTPGDDSLETPTEVMPSGDRPLDSSQLGGPTDIQSIADVIAAAIAGATSGTSDPTDLGSWDLSGPLELLNGAIGALQGSAPFLQGDACRKQISADGKVPYCPN